MQIIRRGSIAAVRKPTEPSTEEPLTIPTNLTIQVNGQTVTFNFDEVTNATSYEIEVEMVV